MTKSDAKKTIQLTQKGLNDLKAELQELVEVKLPAVVKRVAVARAHGDLSENAEYQNAREEQQLVEAKISEIEEVIAKAQVVKSTTSQTKVGMGTKVVVTLKGKSSKKIAYEIVGEFQADPVNGKISSDSPLGKALMGKKKGDQVTVAAPAGKVVYVIKDLK